MSYFIRTTIEFDLSLIKNFAYKEALAMIRATCLREMTKIAFENQEYQYYFISEFSSEERDSFTLPESIKLYVDSYSPLDFLSERDENKSERHTLLPVNYQSEYLEGSIEQAPKSSEYIEHILQDFPYKDSLHELQSISNLINLITSFESLDSKIGNFFEDQKLIENIQDKYEFFYKAICAYQDSNFDSIVPENWSVKDILRLLREGTSQEIDFFSNFCLEMQWQRSQGRVVLNEWVNNFQEEPLHIGLFDTYRIYLSTMQKSLDAMPENFLKQKCIDLFQNTQRYLNRFIDNQMHQPSERSSLKQNAWINALLKIKSLFQWVEMKNFSPENRSGAPDLDWIPFRRVISKENMVYQLEHCNQESPVFKISEEQVNALIEELLWNQAFDFKTYLKEIDQEVSKGYYHLSANLDAGDARIFEQFQSHLSKKNEKSYPSGVGCHLEISEELSARDLIILGCTSLTPVGHFMPLYSFHDGEWRSACWLRGHDLYHEGKSVNTFKRMGCVSRKSGPFRFLKLDQSSMYLSMMHKILSESEQRDKYSEAERNYMYLYLYMGHEVDFGSSDILDLKGSHFLKTFKNFNLSILQDLLFSLKVQVESPVAGEKNSMILKGDYDLNLMTMHAHPVFERVKRNAFVDYINEAFLMI